MDVLCEVAIDVVVVEYLRGRLVGELVLGGIWLCRNIVRLACAGAGKFILVAFPLFFGLLDRSELVPEFHVSSVLRLERLVLEVEGGGTGSRGEE